MEANKTMALLGRFEPYSHTQAAAAWIRSGRSSRKLNESMLGFQ